MIISDEKMQKYYETFVKCTFLNGTFNDANMRRAFESVTADMLREYNNNVMKIAFDSANAISAAELK